MHRLKEENRATTSAAEKMRDIAVKKFKEGDTISYAFIQEVTGMTRHSPSTWGGFVGKLRKLARESRGWTLEAVNNVGFTIMLAEHVVTKRMVQRAGKAMRQATYANRELKAVPDTKLSQHIRSLKHRTLESNNNYRKRAMTVRRVTFAAMGGKTK